MPKNQKISLTTLRQLQDYFPHSVLLELACNAIEAAAELEDKIKTKDSVEYFNRLMDFYKGCKAELAFELNIKTKKNNHDIENDPRIKYSLFLSCMKIIALKLCDYYEEQIIASDIHSSEGLKRLRKKTGLTLQKWARSREYSKGTNLKNLWQEINDKESIEIIMETLTNSITGLHDVKIKRCKDVDDEIRQKRNIEPTEKIEQWTLHKLYLNPSYKRKIQSDNGEKEQYYVNVHYYWLYLFRIKNDRNPNIQWQDTRPEDAADSRETIKRLRRI